MSKAVAKSRADTLREVEADIERSLQHFWEIGELYRRVKKEKLYKETHSNFANYCRDRWGIAEKTVLMTIDAAEVRKQLAKTGDTQFLPPTTSHAADLARVDEADRAKIWNEAVRRRREKDGKIPTHKDVRKVISEHKAKATPRVQPTAEERATNLAMVAAQELRRRAEQFTASVQSLLEHKDSLPEHEAQGCAYTIVSTLHNVAALMEKAGVIRQTVSHGILSGLEEFEDQEAHVVA